MLERTRRHLIDRIKDGDSGALGRLFDSESGLIAARLRLRGASPEEIEDVLQETFLAVWLNATDFRGEGSVAGWIWSIARNRWVSARRRSGRELLLDVLPDPPLLFADPSASVDMARAVQRLSVPMRQVVDAVGVRGLSIEETAAELGLPVGTVKSRLHRARARLEEELT